ncbi:hypothetical protein ERJ75_000949500 [Trypanosoma vivax]|uniref:Uncharacterized protein n=1 Tax=Trypanosoma vivax (strain Y486) TaxID=1055687 RepID=G0U4K5_TRYVY|nr:hypothetical protein ERJ75_000949500 [Trypanosoma vivax]CCC52369.1 conserved hypothetical protein [Trypanosoma vivax Y486]
MQTKNAHNKTKDDVKADGRGRADKDVKLRQSANDAGKQPVGDSGRGKRPKNMPVGNFASVKQKAKVVATTSWSKDGSSPSFADVARKMNDFKVLAARPEELINAGEILPVDTDNVDVTCDMGDEVGDEMGTLINDNEEAAYIAMQRDAPIMQAVLSGAQEEEIQEPPPIKYYVLEIDRIVEEPTVLPLRVTAVAAEQVGTYTFSGQPGNPPTPPAPQLQKAFYHSEATRSFPMMGCGSEIGRSSHWNAQSSHPVDLQTLGWRLQDNPRSFHPGMQYGSYAPPGQPQTQRAFGTQQVRMRQNEVTENPLRAFRDHGPFGRSTGNGSNVW